MVPPRVSDAVGVIPWEGGARLGVLPAIAASLWLAIISPTRYANGMLRMRGELMTPIVFALLCGAVGRLGQAAFVAWAQSSGWQGVMTDDGFGIPHQTAAEMLARLPLWPLNELLWLAIHAAAARIVIRGAGRAPFEAAFRVFAYASVAWCLLPIPGVGPLLSWGLLMALHLAGLRVVHGAALAPAMLALLPVYAMRWMWIGPG